MPEVLGIDWAEDFEEVFGDDLIAATFTRRVTGAIDVNDPSGPPAVDTSVYACKAMSFRYTEDFVSGATVHRADYQVAILLGSIAAIADDAEPAMLDLATKTSHVDVEIAAADDGTSGNAITIELVGDAPTAAGTIVVIGTNVRIGFLPGSTTTDEIVDLITLLDLIVVTDPGAGGVALDGTDVFASTPLAGGSDATQTQAPGIVPRINDVLHFAPPDSDAPIDGTILSIIAITYAQVTVHVRGLGA